MRALRLALCGAIVMTLAYSGVAAQVLRGGWPSVVSAAPANMGAGPLVFSEDVDGKNRPEGERTEFGSGIESIWISFEYDDYNGEKMGYIIRANGEDYRFGDLDCCEGKKGRYAFEFTRGDKGIPGAAYEVRIYANDAEIAMGGFGVKGRQGLDNDGQGGGDNDNN
jgi:hypothetical protein